MDHRRKKSDPDSAAQLDRFKETARALGCDEDEAAFDEKLKVIVRQKKTPESAEGRNVGKPRANASRRSKD